MPKLSEREQEAFLSEPGVLMRVATVTDTGQPHVTPIWFLCEDTKIFFTPRKESEWLAHLRSRPDVALSIDEQPLPYRKVIVEGSAALLYDLGDDDKWRDLYRRIARRYVPREAAEAYVQNTIDQPRVLFAVDLAAARVRSWRMPAEGEDPTGIWHERYYEPGSALAETAKVSRSSR